MPNKSAELRRGRFVEEYLVDLNATAAAKRAGYTSGRNHASRLLLSPDIQAAIAAEMAVRAERTGITQDWVIATLKANADRAMQAIPVTRDGKETGEWRYDGATANRALELIGRHLGMFAQRHELSGPIGTALEMHVVHEIVDPLTAPSEN